MKDHTSHDILLLCPRCHQLSNASDLVVREKLATECDAPLSSKEATRKIDVPRLRYVPYNMHTSQFILAYRSRNIFLTFFLSNINCAVS